MPLLVLHETTGAVQRLVEGATGWPGLGIIFVYSFLIAFILPGPSEIVLAAPLDLGLSYPASLSLIVVVSSVGKAAGSVVAFRVGKGVKESGPVVGWLRRSRFDVVEWSEKRAVEFAREWGYLGLALALCVPFFPDTLSVYAFAVLEEDDLKFALATFAGSVGRYLLVIGVVGGSLSVL
jgi:membrane protein YqaA with SNARE-associated domain